MGGFQRKNDGCEQEASDEDVDNKYGKEILSETNDLCGRRDNLVSEPIE
jgi:hypothetical protein